MILLRRKAKILQSIALINIATDAKIITRILSHGYSLNARPDLSYKTAFGALSGQLCSYSS